MENEMREKMLQELKGVFRDDQIKSDDFYRAIYGRDASYFNITPEFVVRPDTIVQVIELIRIVSHYGQGITFRSGGTSLSGQSLGSGVICELRTGWKGLQVRDKGGKVWFEPGLTCSQVNKALLEYKHKLGPDPGSHIAAMMGGIMANNSSGMQAGTRYNSYRMINSLHFVLANGNDYDSAKVEDRQRFEATERELCQGLMQIRDEILNNVAIKDKIEQKYKIKNVTGYGMNSFLDYDNPMDIFIHLLIGSEGTLAFIAGAEQNTVALRNYYSSTVLYFNGVDSAAAAVPALCDTPALSVEMMDYASLKSLGNRPSIPDLGNIKADATALLLDYGADTQEEMMHLTEQYMPLFEKLDGIATVTPFTKTVRERAELWYIRDGIFPCVAGARALGDNVILEDVAAPPEKLYNLVVGLQDLFHRHQYHGSLFGHARDGNLHPLVNTHIIKDDDRKEFADFMGGVVDLVLSLNGSLKGEHGTGRAVAPFVEREWGSEIYLLMKRIKKLADPLNVLNPGVLINDDPEVYIKSIKEMTPFAQDFNLRTHDKCIECGYCEHVCPSRNVTLTPRQRIQMRRIIKNSTDKPLQAYYEKTYHYEGTETCASDGMCQVACPLRIDTADLTDELRMRDISGSVKWSLLCMAHHFKGAEETIKGALTMAVDTEKVVSAKPLDWSMDLAHFISHELPHWSRHFVKAPKFVPNDVTDPDVVYFPACVTRIFGSSNLGKDNLMVVIKRIAEKAGINLWLPKEAEGLCCSQIWEHKGEVEGQKFMANKLIEHFWVWSAQGKIPIMCDTTSCTHTLLSRLVRDEGQDILTEENLEHYLKIKIIPLTTWLKDEVLTRATVQRKKGKVLLHPTCACDQMGLTPVMEQIAQQCAEHVVIPNNWSCCGASGDRGFMYPELVTSALQEEGKEIGAEQYDGYYSLARTCEIALMDHTDRAYESIAYLVDESI